MRRILVYPLVLLLAGASAVAACSRSEDGNGKSSLQKALARLGATADTRAQLTYGETRAIVKIAGRDWANEKGFAPLRTIGVESLAPYGAQVATDTGVNLFDADYAIAAGGGTKAVGVISGGQQGERVAAAMTKLGWRQEASRLLAPDIGVVGGTTAGQYALAFAKLQTDRSDVLYGERESDLAMVGKPSGQKLSDDKHISALVDCLGDVVAAEFDGTAAGSVTRPTMIAVGVRRPAGKGSTPRAVACFSWQKSPAADKFASKLTSDLKTAKAHTGDKYSQILTKFKVTKVGGKDNIVRWQADTPGDALLVMQLLARSDLPGLH